MRAGGEGKSATLEVWGGGRLLKELAVPKTLHGGVYNDGWFGAGAAWSPDESRLAYVAEVTRLRLQKMTSSCGGKPKISQKNGTSSSGTRKFTAHKHWKLHALFSV